MTKIGDKFFRAVHSTQYSEKKKRFGGGGFDENGPPGNRGISIYSVKSLVPACVALVRERMGHNPMDYHVVNISLQRVREQWVQSGRRAEDIVLLERPDPLEYCADPFHSGISVDALSVQDRTHLRNVLKKAVAETAEYHFAPIIADQSTCGSSCSLTDWRARNLD